MEKNPFEAWLEGTSLNRGEVVAAFTAWSFFLVLLVAATLTRCLMWCCTPRGNRSGGTRDIHPSTWCACLLYWWSTPWMQAAMFATGCFIDLGTDMVLLAKLWPPGLLETMDLHEYITRYVFRFIISVVVTFFVFVPTITCAVVVTVQGLKRLRGLNACIRILLFPCLLPLVIITFPLILAGLLVLELLGVRKSGSSIGFLGGLPLRVDKLSNMFSAVTACTEDPVVSCLMTASMLTEAFAPMEAQEVFGNRFHIPVWSFYMSIVTAMLHMVLEWWTFVGNLLDHGCSMSWVGPACMLFDERSEALEEIEHSGKEQLELSRKHSGGNYLEEGNVDHVIVRA